jgi:capsular polysaccharide biosynthesis protein
MNNVQPPASFVKSPELIKLGRSIVTPSMLTVTARGVHNSSMASYFDRRARLRTHAVGALSILKNGLRRLPQDGRYFHVFNVWAAGYYHWLTEVAPKFTMFEEQLRSGTTLIPRRCPGFILDFLSMFGFDDLLEVDKCVLVTELNVVTDPPPRIHDPTFIGTFRRRVLEKCGISGDVGNRLKVYVSRRHAAQRKVRNEDEVEQFLKEKGFICVELEDYSFENEVSLFANCGMFVTIHGAALSNCMFMPENSRVVELVPRPKSEHDTVILSLQNLGKAVNLDYVRLLSDLARPDEPYNIHSSDIVVNIDQLAEILNK